MADLLAELQQLQQFLTNQGQMLEGRVLEQQGNVWTRKLTDAHLTAAQAQGYIDVIRAGPWAEGQKRHLIEAVNTSVLRSSIDRGAPRRGMQTCGDITSYFSREDQRILRDPQISTYLKMEQVASRCYRIGLHLPSEQTSRHVLAVAHHIGLKRPANADEAYECLQIFKRSLKNFVKAGARAPEHITHYPGDPGNLPQSILATAYDANDPPVGLTVALAELAPAQAAIPCRKANRLLSRNQRQMVPVQTHGASSSTGGTGGMGGPNNPMAQAAMNMMGMFMQMMQGGQDYNVDLQMLNPNLGNPRRTRQQRALTNGEPASSPPAGTGTPAPSEAESGTPARSPQSEPVTGTPARSDQTAAETPSPRALTLPDVSAEEQVDAFAAALAARADAKQDAKQDEEAAEAPSSGSKDPAPKPSGKAKPASKPKAKAKAAAEDKGKSGENAKEADALEPEKKKQKKQLKPKERTIHPLGSSPPVMGPDDPTVYYGEGKINRNSLKWRVFAKSTDKHDKAFKIGTDEASSWKQCLEYIENQAKRD